MTRTLETLIEQFNKASEVDRFFRFKGKPYWLEVDGVPTRMVDTWVGELSSEEKATFEAHLAQVADGTAKALGYENSGQQFKDAGQQVVMGLSLGIVAKAEIEERIANL